MSTQVFFDNIQQQVINNIETANNNIRAAVAWFTDANIYRAVMAAAKRGVKTELILLSDDINKNSGLDFLDLERAGVFLYWYNSDFSGIMHHKFCVIDNHTAITGSYNWTNSAANVNRENLTVIQESTVAKEFIKEFLYLREEISKKCKVLSSPTPVLKLHPKVGLS